MFWGSMRVCVGSIGPEAFPRSLPRWIVERSGWLSCSFLLSPLQWLTFQLVNQAGAFLQPQLESHSFLNDRFPSSDVGIPVGIFMSSAFVFPTVFRFRRLGRICSEKEERF